MKHKQKNMVKIPGATYSMGAHPVTVMEYIQYCLDCGEIWKPYFIVKDRLNHPATYVEYYKALRYVKWLSSQTGENYRLPTAIEWKYCCIAGQPIKSVREFAAKQLYTEKTVRPANETTPNPWGLYGMMENIWEMTSSKSFIRAGGYGRRDWITTLGGIPVGSGPDFDEAISDAIPQYGVVKNMGRPFVGFRIVKDA
jgi:formylglycine-generating enzyme required for sulfatase activity